MTIRVLLFALARDVAGTDALELEIPAGATVGDVRRRLAELHPELAPVLARSMLAVNEEYAAEASAVPDGAELACIPPVSGG